MNILDKEYKFDSNVIMISETDTKGVITYVNSAFCNVSGYTKEELIGKPHNIIRHPSMPKMLFERIWFQLKSSKPWSGSLKNLRKDVSYFWVHAEIVPDVEPVDHVKRLAKLTKDSGLDGVVCSAQEAKILREMLGQEFALVTPGIRPEGTNADDQKRIVTPKQAMLDGSTHLVIGRPITKAAQPTEMLKSILASI